MFKELENFIIKKEENILGLMRFVKGRVSLTPFEKQVFELDVYYKANDYPDNTIPYVIAAQVKKPLNLILQTILTIEAIACLEVMLENGL